MSNIRTRTLWMLLALAACGGGGTTDYSQQPPAPPPPPPPGGGNPPSQGSVAMVGRDDGYGTTVFSFSPAAITIARGGTITWTNGTGVLHNVTFVPATGAPQNVGNFSAGSGVRTFSTSGTFNYQCTNHAGMTGQIGVI